MGYHHPIWLVGFILLLALMNYTEGQMVPAVFVFGDSLADVGNNNHLRFSLVRADFPHNGIDFPGGKATGRFSNGKNSADFMAEKLGLPTSPPYLSLTSASNKSNAFSGGVNFASGGAGILDTNSSRFSIQQKVASLNQQIDYYSTVYGQLVQQLGNSGIQNYLSKSLFAIVIGSNDILGYFKSGSKLPEQNTPRQFIDLLILTLKGQLKKIYNLGARKFVVIGAGAIGCCPSQRSQNKTGGCYEETNYWSFQYNEGLKSLFQAMRSEVKDINFSFLDTYSLLLDFIQEPAHYGFNEVKAACCGLGNLNARIPCIPIAKYCSNRNDHVFWDLYHPTEAAAKIFAETIFEGSQQYVYPINVRQLVAI